MLFYKYIITFQHYIKKLKLYHLSYEHTKWHGKKMLNDFLLVKNTRDYNKSLLKVPSTWLNLVTSLVRRWLSSHFGHFVELHYLFSLSSEFYLSCFYHVAILVYSIETKSFSWYVYFIKKNHCIIPKLWTLMLHHLLKRKERNRCIM